MVLYSAYVCTTPHYTSLGFAFSEKAQLLSVTVRVYVPSTRTMVKKVSSCKNDIVFLSVLSCLEFCICSKSFLVGKQSKTAGLFVLKLALRSYATSLFLGFCPF